MEKAGINILFLGNSHTYLHHMPRMIEILAQGAQSPRHIDTHQVVGEGVDLQWHTENRQSRAKIASRSWDFVILQERSGGPLEDPVSMFAAARQLDCLIRGQGARTVFFMTWARHNQPETQATIANAYSEISCELNALLAPVGLIWQQAQNDLPQLALHHRDGRHASAIGAYLTACTFANLFLEVAPGDLPTIISMDGRKKVALSQQTAHTLQQIVSNQLATAKVLSPTE